MPELTIGGAFDGYDKLKVTDRVALNKSGDLVVTGSKPGNIFSRFASWALRSKDVKAANKETAGAFIKEVEKRYGKQAANLVAKDLSAHVSSGRPLSVYRIQRSLEKAEDLRVYGNLSKKERANALKLNLTPEEIIMYREAQIPIHSSTLVKDFQEKDCKKDSIKRLGGGSASSVYKVSFLKGGNTLVDTAFKEGEAGNGLGLAGITSGIKKEESYMISRSIATRELDKALGFEVVPETQVGIVNGKVGLVMEMVKGSGFYVNKAIPVTDDEIVQLVQLAKDQPEAWQYLENQGYILKKDENDKLHAYRMEIRLADIDFKDPGVRRELVKLQLLDALCGQVDRHGGNYLVDLDTNGKFQGLKGIDNDQAFGSKITDPNDILENHDHCGKKIKGGWHGFRGVKLPEVVDTDMKSAFDKLTANDVREMLDGLLPKEDVEAAVKRLSAIKSHLSKLERKGKVIKPDEWGGSVADKGLLNPETSYVARAVNQMKHNQQLVVAYE